MKVALLLILVAGLLSGTAAIHVATSTVVDPWNEPAFVRLDNGTIIPTGGGHP